MTYPPPTKIFIDQTKSPILTGPLYVRLETCKEKIIALQGGGDAGKTVTVIQWLTIKAIETPKLIIRVVAESVPNLKSGAIQTFFDYVEGHEQIRPFLSNYNVADKTQYFKNGSMISFKSYDNDRSARGSESDYLFLNEVNNLTYNLFWELQRKCRIKVLMDFNPTYKFFVHHKLIDAKDSQFVGKVKRFICDHRDNPFLSEDTHADYESISDPEKFRVYARGLTGKVEGTIFNFTKVDKIPEKLPFGFGIDFGYNQDKTSIVKVYWEGRNRYYEELYYKVGVDTEEIAGILKINGCTTSTYVWGDHDKNASTYLRKMTIPFRMARKGPNSLTASISKVNEYNNFYFESPHLEDELKTYVWAQGIDLLTGNEVSLNVPVDGMEDHSIAAIRYFIYSHSLRFVS